jgi:hypothetical protein
MPSTSFHPGDRVGFAQQGRRSHSARAALAAGVLLLGALASACTAAQRCEELASCGGDLMQGAEANAQGLAETEWVANAEGACMDEIQLPVQPISIQQQPAKGAGKKPVGQATVDWCSSLVLKPDGSLGFQGFFPIIPMKVVTLKITSDGSYDAHFSQYAPQIMNFSAACRAAQGINESCQELGRHIKEAIAAESNVTNMRCYDIDEGGCECAYELLLLNSLPGTWGAAGTKATFYDNSLAPAPPSTADFCVNGDTLTMTGHNGSQLFNRPALRTLTFHHATCSDGIQSEALNEEGVDCGGECPPCGTCNDQQQNGLETGVDCGGNCPDFCACFNGVRDPWEEGVDCGGTCSLLCTCLNGVQDEGREDGVDCGGECQLRYSDPEAKPCP